MSPLTFRRDGSKAFEVVEEDFDEVALAIELSSEPRFDVALGLRVNDGLHSPIADGLKKAIRVVSGVTDERFASGVFEQLIGCHHFVPLPRRERDVDGPPLRVDDGVEFGRKTSSRAAQSISFDPPFPPDAS